MLFCASEFKKQILKLLSLYSIITVLYTNTVFNYFTGTPSIV